MKIKKENLTSVAALYFMRRGFAGASLRDISKSTGITVSTIFSHFENKEDLYRQVIDKYVINAPTPAEILGDCTNMSLSQFIEHYAEVIDETKKYLKTCVKQAERTYLDENDRKQTYLEDDMKKTSLSDYLTFKIESGEYSEAAAETNLRNDEDEIGIITEVVARAQANGEVKGNLDPRSVAEILHFTFVGLSHVYCQKDKDGFGSGDALARLRVIYDLVKN